MKKGCGRMISLALAFCVAIGCVGLLPTTADAALIPAGYGSFVDLAEKPGIPWYVNYLNKALDMGLYNGVSATTFEPDRAITRGETVTVLGRMHESQFAEMQIGEAGETPFEDVPLGRYYTRYVAWTRENGLIIGVTETAFEPDRPVTQQELAVLFAAYTAFFEESMETDLTSRIGAYPPTDAPAVQGVSDWAAEAVTALSGMDLFEAGEWSDEEDRYIGGRWDPQAEVKRGESAAFFVRLYEKLAYPRPDETLSYSAYAYSVTEETPIEGETGAAGESGDGTETAEPKTLGGDFSSFHILDATVSAANGTAFQIIEDYETYRALLEKMEWYGDYVERYPNLFVNAAFFETSSVLAVESFREGDPQFKTELAGLSVEVTEPSPEEEPGEDGGRTETPAITSAAVTVLKSGNAGGSTADKIGYVYLLEIPREVSVVTVDSYTWTEDYTYIGAID